MINRKHIIASSLLMVALMGFNSCDENLDINPTSELESNYFENEERIQRGVGTAYAGLANVYGAYTALPPFWLLPGDDMTFDGSGAALETFSGSNGYIENIWRRLYVIIAACNFMLDKLEDPAIAAVYETPELREHNRGELLFLKSYSYFKLWDWFRKAPLQPERINSVPDAILTPSQGFEMLDQAIASLEEAATLLPDSWDGRNTGRITKDAAYGLLVKCYVIRANYNGNDAEDFRKAIAAFEKISDSRRLVAFGENFDYRHENNAESLFEYQASFAPKEDNAWLDNGWFPDASQMGAYYTYSGGHWGNYLSGALGPTMKLVEAFDPEDPRMAETVTQNPDNLDGKLWWVAPWDKFNGYQMVKYVNGARGDINDKNWQLSSANNPRILRLADVKLLAAEAYLATGNSEEALKQVNDIRERARKSTPDGTEAAAPAALSSITMEDIMHERFLELAGEEGHRWTDLRRWHAAGYIDLASWTAEDFGYPYDPSLFAFDVDRHLLFPIPVSELERNPLMAQSGQNPGY